MPPRISFITAVHNRLDLTKKMLETFKLTIPPTENFEYIFIDDASSDGSRLFLSQLSPPYKLFVNDRSPGFSGANNRGALEARGEFIIFLNNDLIFNTEWLTDMIEPLKDESVGAVGNIQIDPATGLIDHAGMFFDLDGMPRLARKNTRLIPSGDYREWNCLSAACLAMRRDCFLKMGGFDEGYRNGCEDCDLSIRLRINGYRLLVANKSRIIHIGGSSPGRHDHNSTNEARLLSLWLETVRPWAKTEWAREYLIRYSLKWWRLNPIKALLACRVVIAQALLKSIHHLRDRA